jgi:tetratricopeptide (TPR) repeat protein
MGRRRAAFLLGVVAPMLPAGAWGDARADGTRAYHAGRFSEALAAFEKAARARPADPEPVADVALALQKLDRHDDAVAANRKVIRLASRPGKGKPAPARLARIRQGAYFNLGRLGVASAVPEADACGAVANDDPACKRPLFACRMSRLQAGSGLGTHWDVLRLARDKQGAAFDQADYQELPPLVAGLSDDMYDGSARLEEILAGQEGDGLLRYGMEEMGDECARIHGSEWSCDGSEAVRREALHCLGPMAPASASNYDLKKAPSSAACYRRACERAEKAPWPAVTTEEDAHAEEMKACYEGLSEIEDTTCVVVHADACAGLAGIYCTTTIDRAKGKPQADRHRAYEIKIPAPAGT